MIARIGMDDFDRVLPDLTNILQACVADGASIGFVLPFSHDQAQRYWVEQVYPGLALGEVELFVAHDGDRIAGTVQLARAGKPNQPHRSDVAKLLVHPDARRRGLGRALMRKLEDRATELHQTLLVLDTRSSDPSLLLYCDLGFQIAGEIPNYCLDPTRDHLDPTTYMYKNLLALSERAQPAGRSGSPAAAQQPE